MDPLMSTDLSVCIDCLSMLANGELGQGDREADKAHADTMAAEWPPSEYDLTIACDDECEGYFGVFPCQGCGSVLAGERHPVVAWGREPAMSDRAASAIADLIMVDAELRAGLGVGHIWTATDCPAYRTLNGADCTCERAS